MKSSVMFAIASSAAFVLSGQLLAHHSGSMYSTTPVWFEGTVVRFEPINPHTLITVEQPAGNGATRQWIVEGPPQSRLNRAGAEIDAPPVGVRIRVCGFPYRSAEELAELFPGTDFSTRRFAENADGSGPRYVVGHLLQPDGGEMRFWEPHGLISECMRTADQPRQLWIDFINSNSNARNAWCEQQSYAHVRETAELSALVNSVDGSIDSPCS